MKSATLSIHRRLLGALLALGLLTALPALPVLSATDSYIFFVTEINGNQVTIKNSTTGKTEVITVKDPSKLKLGQKVDHSGVAFTPVDGKR